MKAQHLMVNELTDIHMRVLSWLDDNLQEGRDYAWSSSKSSQSIVLDYLFFSKEEDLLAFKIACGL